MRDRIDESESQGDSLMQDDRFVNDPEEIYSRSADLTNNIIGDLPDILLFAYYARFKYQR